MFHDNSIQWKKEAQAQREILAPEEGMAENSFATPIDLSRPPVVPYSHQKFPKMLYDHKSSKPEGEEKKQQVVNGIIQETKVYVPAQLATCTVHSEQELEARVKEGWSEKPPDFSKRK